MKTRFASKRCPRLSETTAVSISVATRDSSLDGGTTENLRLPCKTTESYPSPMQLSNFRLVSILVGYQNPQSPWSRIAVWPVYIYTKFSRRSCTGSLHVSVAEPCLFPEKIIYARRKLRDVPNLLSRFYAISLVQGRVVRGQSGWTPIKYIIFITFDLCCRSSSGMSEEITCLDYQVWFFLKKKCFH